MSEHSHSFDLQYQGDPSIPEVAEYQRLREECFFAASGHGDSEWSADAQKRLEEQRHILLALGASI